MSSVRLYKRQIDRFSHGNGAKVIACALRRYRDGELVIGSGSHDKDPGNILQLFPVWKKPDVPDALLRAARGVVAKHRRRINRPEGSK